MPYYVSPIQISLFGETLQDVLEFNTRRAIWPKIQRKSAKKLGHLSRALKIGYSATGDVIFQVLIHVLKSGTWLIKPTTNTEHCNLLLGKHDPSVTSRAGFPCRVSLARPTVDLEQCQDRSGQRKCRHRYRDCCFINDCGGLIGRLKLHLVFHGDLLTLTFPLFGIFE